MKYCVILTALSRGEDRLDVNYSFSIERGKTMDNVAEYVIRRDERYNRQFDGRGDASSHQTSYLCCTHDNIEDADEALAKFDEMSNEEIEHMLYGAWVYD